MDGWLVRLSPGKAQRARCINAVATGRQPLAQKLAACAELFRALNLPLLVRITPFTQPPGLDSQLAEAGWASHDDTRVMVLPRLAGAALSPGPAPEAGRWMELPPAAFAEAIGSLRGSSASARAAHAERLRSSPVPYRGFALVGADEDQILACGQFAHEGGLVGLYDIATAATRQRRGLGAWICKRLLTIAMNDARPEAAYLQVGADNAAARRIYQRLGFADAYTYHYRAAPAAPGTP
ncbi:MAG: GNAT family N-acetyltransferase [Rubrivivax sp.]|nr:GNAT family N-acetyltransferase [Rubrivivax sp.]